MTNLQIWQSIESAVKKDKAEKKSRPSNVVSQAAVVSIAAGRLLRSAYEQKFESSNSEVISSVQQDRIKEDAISVIAAAYQFLERLKDDV